MSLRQNFINYIFCLCCRILTLANFSIMMNAADASLCVLCGYNNERVFQSFFVYFFWRARMCRPLLHLCRPFMIFEGCLDSNPEYCRSKLALPTQPPIPLFRGILHVPCVLQVRRQNCFSIFDRKKFATPFSPRSRDE